MIDDFSDYDYEIVVLGNPKPQLRPRATKRGKFITIYDDPKSAKEKRKLEAVVQDYAPEALLDCPLRVDLDFYFARPKDHFGTGRNAGALKASSPKHHITKPDKDNLTKIVMDAMTGVFWRDDSVICDGRTRKIYSQKPRIEIKIKKL